MTGDEARDVRLALGLSRVQMARVLHCSYHSTYNYERHGVGTGKGDNSLMVAAYTGIARKIATAGAAPPELARALRGPNALRALRMLLDWIDDGAGEGAAPAPVPAPLARRADWADYLAGPAPFGYKLRRVGARRGLELEPKEQGTLARLLDLHGQGYQDAYIADTLNAAGCPPRKGGAWTDKNVRNIRQRAASALYGRFLIDAEGGNET